MDGSSSSTAGAPLLRLSPASRSGRIPPEALTPRRAAAARESVRGIHGARGRPRRRELSKSATKTRIELKRRKRIVDIPRFFSRSIPARGAFVADLDKPPPRLVPGAPLAPLRRRPATANPDKGGGGSSGRRAGPVPALPPRRSSCMAGRRLVCRDAVDPRFVRYALFRLLRPFTLRYAPFSRTAEGEGA